MIRVVCVYRSGGDFTPEYVFRLQSGVGRHLGLPHEFVCLTDRIKELEGVPSTPLMRAWPGWWSKMEVFGLPGPILYFDLDTVIVGSIDPLAEQIIKSKDELLMIRDFYKEKLPSTGILGWSGDMKWILDRFERVVDKASWSPFRGGFYLRTVSRGFPGDQDWLRTILSGQDRVKISLAQDAFLGIRSYKVHIKEHQQLTGREKVICFHGNPRPHEVRDVPWMKENWTDLSEKGSG